MVGELVRIIIDDFGSTALPQQNLDPSAMRAPHIFHMWGARLFFLVIFNKSEYVNWMERVWLASANKSLFTGRGNFIRIHVHSHSSRTVYAGDDENAGSRFRIRPLRKS